MSRHEGVSCDSCLKGNFRGRRFKCLICYDYDLCASCYESGAVTTRHTADHPVQCILTRSDFDTYYAGESLNAEQPQSFTCPYCGRMGFTEATLQEHVSSEHAETGYEVICPICASMPGGDPNLVTDDFAGHLTLEHRSGPRDLISFLDEPSSGTNRHGTSAIRIRHPVTAATAAAGSTGVIPSAGIGRGVYRGDGTSGGSRPRRSNMHFSSSGGLSPSARDTVDPIAELLSQLSGVRRNAAQNSTLQQLQMQLQLERQQVRVARQQLERLPRRPAATTASSTTSTTASIVGTSSAAPSLSAALAPMSTQATPASFGVGSSSGVGVGAGLSAGTAANSGTNEQAGNAPNGAQSQFLLARYTEEIKTEEELIELEKEHANRSLFVQELFLSTLACIDAPASLSASFAPVITLSSSLWSRNLTPAVTSTVPSIHLGSNPANGNGGGLQQQSSFSNLGNQSTNQLNNCDSEVASNVVSSKNSEKRPSRQPSSHIPQLGTSRSYIRGRSQQQQQLPTPPPPQQQQQSPVAVLNRSSSNHASMGSSPNSSARSNPSRPSVRKPARMIDGRNQATEPPPPH